MIRHLTLTAAVLAVACAPAFAQDAEAEAEAEAAEDAAADEEAGLPGVDIYLAELVWGDGLPALAGDPVNATAREGYDNQPAFTGDGSGFYYAAGTEDGQTDIFLCTFPCDEPQRITATGGEGEFSPRPTPAGGALSYIHQPVDGYGGQVWLDTPEGGTARPADERGPFGYYAFNADMTRLAVFALGETFRLQVFGRFEDTDVVTVAEGIGRALYAAPDHDGLFYTLPREGADEGHTVHHVGFDGTGSRVVFDLPGSTEDYAVFAGPDGTPAFFAVSDGWLRYRTEGRDWHAVADLSARGLTGISRLAVSPDRSRLAIVAADGVPPE